MMMRQNKRNRMRAPAKGQEREQTQAWVNTRNFIAGAAHAAMIAHGVAPEKDGMGDE